MTLPPTLLLVAPLDADWTMARHFWGTPIPIWTVQSRKNRRCYLLRQCPPASMRDIAVRVPARPGSTTTMPDGLYSRWYWSTLN